MVLYVIVKEILKVVKRLNRKTFHFNLKNGNSHTTIYYDLLTKTKQSYGDYLPRAWCFSNTDLLKSHLGGLITM